MTNNFINAIYTANQVLLFHVTYPFVCIILFYNFIIEYLHSNFTMLEFADSYLSTYMNLLIPYLH